MEINKFQFIVICSIILKVRCQSITMLTPYVLAKQGESAVLIAKSVTSIPTNQVNWYYNGNAITINGVVSQGNGKYVVTANGTIFTLSINPIKNSDYGLYSLIYLNVQTIQITVVNATISELIEKIAIPQCKNPNSTVAICIILLISYLMLFVTGSILFLLSRADNQGKKIETFSIILLIIVLQVSTVFISAMVTLWGAFYLSTDNRNTTASIFGLVAHLVGWFPIFYFSAYHAKQNKFQLFLGYGLMILTTIQVGMLIGVILCVCHCTNNIILPSIDVDYGILGVLFSVLSMIVSCFIMLFIICYYKINIFNQLIVTLIQTEKSKGSEKSNGDVVSITKSDAPTQDTNENNVNEAIKETPTKKKSLKSRLEKKFRSFKSNKVQNENGSLKQTKNGKVKTAAVNGKSDPTSKQSSPIPQTTQTTSSTPVSTPVVNSISPIPESLNKNEVLSTEQKNLIQPNMTINSQNTAE